MIVYCICNYFQEIYLCQISGYVEIGVTQYHLQAGLRMVKALLLSIFLWFPCSHLYIQLLQILWKPVSWMCFLIYLTLYLSKCDVSLPSFWASFSFLVRNLLFVIGILAHSELPHVLFKAKIEQSFKIWPLTCILILACRK